MTSATLEALVLKTDTLGRVRTPERESRGQSESCSFHSPQMGAIGYGFCMARKGRVEFQGAVYHVGGSVRGQSGMALS